MCMLEFIRVHERECVSIWKTSGGLSAFARLLCLLRVPGLHLIDFEQLKIENTTLNEKIEERNEDLLKLRKKATTTIHILARLRVRPAITQ